MTDPAFLLRDLDVEFFNHYKGGANPTADITYVEPMAYREDKEPSGPAGADATSAKSEDPPTSKFSSHLKSKIVILGDFIDTDALAPGFTLTSCTTDEEFGRHVLCHTHPEFREKVQSGQRIVVAGKAFGVGSSRECAVSALKGAGVQAVIARSFAFIYGRNQPSLGLLGIVMTDERFYDAAKGGEEIEIDLPSRKLKINDQEWSFELSVMEEKLTQNQGVANSFRKFGEGIWEHLTTETGSKSSTSPHIDSQTGAIDERLQW